MTFLETRTAPVPPARMRDPNADNVEGSIVPVGRLLCPPEDDDELDEGGGKNVDCHDIVEEDEKPKGGDDDDPVKETMEEPINKKRQSMVTLAEDEENMEEEVASISSTVQDRRPPHPYANASLISKLFFSWPYSLMGQTASCRVIQESDLPDVLDSDTSEANLRKFQALWEQEKARASKVYDKTARNGSAFEATPKAAYPSLARAIKNDFLFSLWFVQLSMFLNAVGKMVQALSLGFLLQSLESQNGAGLFFAGSLVLSGFVVIVCHHHTWWWTTQTGMRYRMGAIAAIHDKTLHLASASVDSVTSSGRAINLATNDVERFLMSCVCGSYIIWTPLLSIGIFVIGWNIIGWPFASGFALLVLVIVPFQLSLSKKFAIVRAEIASIADERVTLVSQAIAGARVMKIYTYESIFERKIASIRQKEVSSIQRVNRYRALNEAIYFSATIFTSPIIFFIDVLSGGKLTPMKVFTTFVLINIAQQELTKYLSVGIMGVSEATVSISRIQKFLELPELSSLNTPPPLANEDGDASIVVSQATCHWNRSLQVKGPNFRVHGDPSSPNSNDESAGLVVALDNISLRFDKGTLTFVIGEVGAGKSALLQMLAGEITLSSGLIQMRAGSTLAYASQEPFLMQGSVRENILFGRPYDGLTYQTVSHACGLDKDFAQLSDGDATIVGGDRGVQLSGGQRARVALARAFYQDGDILLLDDPLSAVDSKVGRQLFTAIQDLGVKRGKCVVLVTHQHQYIGDSRCVKMTGCRSWVRDAPDLTLSAHDIDECDDREKKAQSPRQDAGVDCGNNKCNVPSSSCTPIIDNDDKYSSNVGVATFISYFKAMPGGLWSGFLVLLLFTLSQGLAAATITLSGKWSMLPHGDQLSRAIMATISGCVLGSVILAVVRGILLFHLVIEASSNLHHSMTKSVLRAKIDFFDQPVGGILDRFSADVGSNDDLLPGLLSDVLTISFMVLGAVTIAITVLPIALILMPPMILVLIRVRRTFVTSSRELKRLEGAARSSMLALLSESLGGIGTIRSNDAGNFFRQRFRNAHDAHGRACFAYAACSRWFGFLMDTIMFAFMAIASFTAVVANDHAWLDIDPNLLGLALTMLIQLSGLFQYGVRQSAEVVNQMVAVDRVLGYHDLPSEAAVTAQYDDEVSTEWPQKGAISVRGLNVRYRPGLHLSLRSLTFEIPGGSRVGVVGRTGCGKSTLVQSLIRLLEAEDGQILIDSVDISKLGLSKLRRSISIMPQFPVLYGGISLRDNLDPYHHREDEEIYQALVHVSMVDAVESLPCGLDTIISEGGSCFSAGQKQLLCLVRAVLRKNKILVLDEPTANVDNHTDKLLQEAVAENFEGATILAIAHRLDTVIDYDKILVLGSGGVLEYGSPRELITNGGAFSMMLDETSGKASMPKAWAATHDVVTATDL